MTKKTERNPSFEKALSELEAIVAAMESGALPLEKMMEQYEQGMGLISFCSAKLNEVEKKIEIMMKRGDKVVPEPFDPEKSDSGENTETKAQ